MNKKLITLAVQAVIYGSVISTQAFANEAEEIERIAQKNQVSTAISVKNWFKITPRQF